MTKRTWPGLALLFLAVACGSKYGSDGGSGGGSNDADAGAPPPIDASVERGTSACSAAHTVCEDFDHGKVGTSLSLTVPSGTADIITTDAYSAPGSLQMTFTTGSYGPSLAAPLPAAHHFRCSVAAKLGSSDDRPLEMAYFGTPTQDTAVILRVYPDGSLNLYQMVAGTGGSTQSSAQGALRKDAWVPVSIEVRASPKPQATVTVNGLVSEFDLVLPDPATGYTTAELEATPTSSQGTGTWTIGYDDWFCDVLP